MSFIGDIFSGDKGAGYTPKYAPITSPLSTPDRPDALNEEAIKQYGNFGNITGHQDALAQMLLAQAQGGGPNPAAAQLQQATNANQAMTAGTIAATKGINPALAARQAAMMGSGQQQQAASQGAQLRANQQLAGQSGLQQLYGTQGQQNLQQQNIFQSAMANLNNANVANAAQQSGAQSKVAAQNAGTQGGILSGLFGAGMNAVGSLAHGGEVKPSGPQSKVGQFLHQTLNKSVGSAMKAGGKVPGQAEVPGDSLKNDTVAAKLSPGEIVIPRSVVNSKDPAKGAADFVSAVLAKGGHSLPPKGKK